MIDPVTGGNVRLRETERSGFAGDVASEPAPIEETRGAGRELLWTVLLLIAIVVVIALFASPTSAPLSGERGTRVLRPKVPDEWGRMERPICIDAFIHEIALLDVAHPPSWHRSCNMHLSERCFLSLM